MATARSSGMKKILAAFPLLLIVGSACSSAPVAGEHSAQVSASVTAVPTGVACIAIDAGVAEEPLFTQRFDVAAGKATTLNMTGLPSGAVTFSAFAYATACASVTATSTATWASQPVLATLASQSVTNISLVLRPAAAAAIGVTFASCPQGQGSCDGTTCTSLSTDANNCGACADVCPQTRSPATGMAVSQGVCVAGACQACATGATLCAQGCRDLSNDATACGSCANVCPSTRSPVTGLAVSQGLCTAGSCSQQCVAGATQCASGCKDLSSDPNACGTCANVCPTKLNATGKMVQESCVAGACQ